MKTDPKIIEHYSSIDFSIWEKETSACLNKIEQLKTNKSKRVWQLKLYSLYIQIIEFFAINIFVFTENNLINLFITNQHLQEKIKSRFDRKSNFVSLLLEKLRIFDKKSSYKYIIEESIKDYLKDFSLLNAYKHGVRSHGENQISISQKY